MIQTRRSSVQGGAVSGNLLGKRLSKPKSQFSLSSGSGASESGNKKAKRNHGSVARKAILQEDEPTAVEPADRQAEASSSVRTGSSATGAGTSSQWDAVSVSMKVRFASLLGVSEGIYPTDGSKAKLSQIEQAMEAAKEWINQRTMEDALVCLYTFDSWTGAGRKDAGTSSKQPSVQGETSRTSSSVAGVGESQFVTPLIPRANAVHDMFRDVASMVAVEDDQAVLGGAGRNKAPREDEKSEGVGRNPDLQDMMRAAREGDRFKLEASLADHMGRSSLKLERLSPSQRTEYGAYKLAETYLGLICGDMEALEEVYAEASLGNEAVARFIREKVAGSPADPAYWRPARPGGKLISHVRGHQLRLIVEKEYPAGTRPIVEAKASELPMMSAFGAKVCEEASKQALKDVKQALSQQKHGSTKEGADKGAGSSRPPGTPETAKRGNRGLGCHACGSSEHRAYEEKCEEGRKWVAGKRAAGTWRERN